MSSILFRGAKREQGVLLIAGSIEDFGSFFIDPRGTRIKGKTSGLGPAKKMPCPACTTPKRGVELKPGMVADKFGRFAECEMCGGKGWLWADETEQGLVPVQTAGTNVQTKQPKKRKCEHCQGLGALPNEKRCHWCKGEGRIVVDAFVLAEDRGTEKDPLDAYTDAIARRDKSGSYPEYLLLEAELRARSPHLLRPFRALYVDVPRAKSLPPHEVRFAARALRFFVDWMPDPVRVPGWVVRADEAARAQSNQKRAKGKSAPKEMVEARDALIVERYKASVPTPTIAVEVGLSVSQVQRVLNRAA